MTKVWMVVVVMVVDHWIRTTVTVATLWLFSLGRGGVPSQNTTTMTTFMLVMVGGFQPVTHTHTRTLFLSLYWYSIWYVRAYVRTNYCVCVCVECRSQSWHTHFVSSSLSRPREGGDVTEREDRCVCVCIYNIIYRYIYLYIRVDRVF